MCAAAYLGRHPGRSGEIMCFFRSHHVSTVCFSRSYTGSLFCAFFFRIEVVPISIIVDAMAGESGGGGGGATDPLQGICFSSVGSAGWQNLVHGTTCVLLEASDHTL